MALCRRISYLYALALLTVYALFLPLGGYERMMEGKYRAFLLLSLGYVLAMTALGAWRAVRWREPMCLAALAYLALTALSAALSPYGTAVLLGGTRRDGLLTAALYIAVFLLLARHLRPDRRLLYAAAASAALCGLLVLVQLTGRNPLWLYPAGLNYFDGDVAYSGFYAGAAGNIDFTAFLLALCAAAMAAALAGCGGVFTASAWQVGTLFAADALTTLIHELLLPLVYCHIALASAGAALPESGLDKLADGLKKLISWLLCGAVTAFTLYLSVSGVLTGSADRAAVKAAQTAVSGAVPVVGSILAESAEMVLSAAHSLRAAIGAAGVLGVLLACLAPLVRLSVQFLLYRAAAFVSAVSGVKPLERLLEQLGDAFTLVLGMTAACAALLLAALLVSISMVVM